MRIDLVSLFPGYFEGPFGSSMLHRAQQQGALEINLVDLRTYGEGRWKQVDDRPYGGGEGMVLMAPPLLRALEEVTTDASCVIYMSPQGRPLNSAMAERLAGHTHLVVVCGHYEGIDQRVIDQVDEEISIGDYVLTNGCAPAIVLVDAVTRFLPGVLRREVVEWESHHRPRFDWPLYTRPTTVERTRTTQKPGVEKTGNQEPGREKVVGKGQESLVEVPEVLRSGNHKAVRAWQQAQALRKTVEVRPELFSRSLVEFLEREEKGLPKAIVLVESLLPLPSFYRQIGGKVTAGGEKKGEEASCLRVCLGDQHVVMVATGAKTPSSVVATGDLPFLQEKLMKGKIEFSTWTDAQGAWLTFSDPNRVVWVIQQSTKEKNHEPSPTD